MPVISYGTDDFPAFFSPSSGVPSPLRLDNPSEVALTAKVGVWDACKICWNVNRNTYEVERSKAAPDSCVVFVGSATMWTSTRGKMRICCDTVRIFVYHILRRRQ